MACIACIVLYQDISRLWTSCSSLQLKVHWDHLPSPVAHLRSHSSGGIADVQTNLHLLGDARRCSENTWSACCTWSLHVITCHYHHYLAEVFFPNVVTIISISSPSIRCAMCNSTVSLWVYGSSGCLTCNSTFGIFSACPKKLIVERLSENWIWRTMPLTSFCWAMQHPPWHTAGYSRFPKHPRTRQLQFDIYDFQTKPSSLGPRCNKLCFPLQCQDFVQNSAWMAYGRGVYMGLGFGTCLLINFSGMSSSNPKGWLLGEWPTALTLKHTSHRFVPFSSPANFNHSSWTRTNIETHTVVS